MSSPTSRPEVKSVLAIKRRGLTLALLTMAYFFSYMDRSILAILQEAIVRDLHIDDLWLGIIGGPAFAIFYAGLGLPIARLADRTNRVRIIAIALAIWSGFTALGGLVTNFWQLALARIGVGIGEAGSSPPSHSIIADLYPPEKRAGAMAIYSLGVGLGAAMGTTIGGTMLYFYGWRAAFYVVGLPGLVLAALIYAIVPEPKRGLSDAQIAMEDSARVGLLDGARNLFANRAALHVVMGFTITSMIGYGHGQFVPSYLIRSFHFTTLDIAWKFAPLGALVVFAGTIGSGKLADQLARGGYLHRQASLVALLKSAALPCTVVFCLTSSSAVAVTAYMLSVLLGACYLGATFSLIQSEAPLHQRAMWAAITLLVNNMIGLGLGPLVVGGVSTVLKPIFGAESLRYAMLIFAAITPWAIFHYWRAGVLLKRAWVERQAVA